MFVSIVCFLDTVYNCLSLSALFAYFCITLATMFQMPVLFESCRLIRT